MYASTQLPGSALGSTSETVLCRHQISEEPLNAPEMVGLQGYLPVTAGLPSSEQQPEKQLILILSAVT